MRSAFLISTFLLLPLVLNHSLVRASQSTDEKKTAQPFTSKQARLLHSALEQYSINPSKKLRITIQKTFKSYLASHSSDPDLIEATPLSPDQEISLLQLAVKTGEPEWVELALQKRGIKPDLEASFEVGSGTPPRTARAFWELLPEDSEKQKKNKLSIKESLDRHHVFFINCMALVQLNDKDAKGTNLRDSPSKLGKVISTVPQSKNTQFLVTGFNQGWLRVKTIYPEGISGWGKSSEATSQNLKGDHWIWAELTRVPDFIVKERAPGGTYIVKRCFLENLYTKTVDGKEQIFTTSNIENSL